MSFRHTQDTFRGTYQLGSALGHATQMCHLSQPNQVPLRPSPDPRVLSASQALNQERIGTLRIALAQSYQAEPSEAKSNNRLRSLLLRNAETLLNQCPGLLVLSQVDSYRTLYS
jgi:hypothetical protein